MAQPKRILFVASEVAPFVTRTDLSATVAALPVALHEANGADVRSTVPRYGTVSERRHGLHDVIRLSGTEVPMGTAAEPLDVKVASLPDTRLQVYFMDHDGFFGRDAVATDEAGAAFDDNPMRALFFARAALETFRKLRWAPDVVHAFGWAAGLVPALLTSAYDGGPVLGDAAVVFTPDLDDPGPALDDAFGHAASLPDGLLGDLAGGTLNAAGRACAHATVLAPGADADDTAEALRLPRDPAEAATRLLALYDEAGAEIPV